MEKMGSKVLTENHLEILLVQFPVFPMTPETERIKNLHEVIQLTFNINGGSCKKALMGMVTSK